MNNQIIKIAETKGGSHRLELWQTATGFEIKDIFLGSVRQTITDLKDRAEAIGRYYSIVETRAKFEGVYYEPNN